MKFILLIVFIFFFVECKHSDQKVKIDKVKPQNYYALPPLRYYLTSNDTLRYAVFNLDSKRDVPYRFSKLNRPTKISNEEISEIERLISDKVKRYNQLKKLQIKAPEKYYKQFIPSTNLKGQKEVWVNCLCAVEGNLWKIRIQHVMDGGVCYFQLKINLSTGAVYNFTVNGLA